MNALLAFGSPEWREACFLERGCLLEGFYSHWCWDWDGLVVDETCVEFLSGCCTCFDEESSDD